MYMAYGWPQVIPMESPSFPSTQQIVYLKVLNGLLLVVLPTSLELWSSSQHRVRLGKQKRDAESLKKEGENFRAIWSPDAKLIAVLTSQLYLHIFKIQMSEKKIRTVGKQPTGLLLANLSLVLSDKVPFSDGNFTVSNFVCDNKNMLIGLSDGSLYNISWKGEFCGAFFLQARLNGKIGANALSYQLGSDQIADRNQIMDEPNDLNHSKEKASAVVHLEFSIALWLLLVLFSDGELDIFSVSKKGLRHADGIVYEMRLNSKEAVCTSVSPTQQILAVGTQKGTVELYDLANSLSPIRSVSLHDWGYSVDDTGPINCIAWTPDSSAFSVGWKLRGLTVWSVSGCRLMSTIRRIGLNSASSPVVKFNQDVKYEPRMVGTSLMHWDEHGYRLYAVEQGCSEKIIAFSFGKSCLNGGVSGITYSLQIICGEDRLLIVQSECTDELKMLHLILPVSYISQNWPVLHVAASSDGTYLAISGVHGLILHDMRLKRWRVFGDVTQEQKIQCKGLLWVGKIVVICNYVDSSDTYELLFYPRYHLDKSSLLCRKPLLTKPLAMDAYQDYILVTYPPFDTHIFHVKLIGELSLSSSPEIQLSTVRELSIMTAKGNPVAMRFIPDQLPRENIRSSMLTNSRLGSREPSRCLILRGNGDLSLLDLLDGRERKLSDSVELFWVTCGQTEEKTNLIEEVSWLDYGHRGMQVWYPSPGVDPFKQEEFLQLDPEMEFDREVYPLGLLPNAGVVVGVSQRVSSSSCTEFPCYETAPQAQTILHCLLRHLLQRDKRDQALRLAQLSAEKPHFSHCLEWLLFTVFESEVSRHNSGKSSDTISNHSTSFLEKTCDLIRNFPEYYDVVVSVARKTDGRHWGDLFSASGRSTELFEECFQRRWYRTAACYILVIDKLEGPAVSQYCALRLLQAALDDSLYELAGELVRYLLRSGREYEPSVGSDKHSPQFLEYLLPSSFKNQPQDAKGSSFKESSAHVASVKSILESHASYLMSGKELSKLVAFVKGTHFDLVEYLQREGRSSARLENFASGLEMIRQKLQMGTLQSRLDAEFLLAHMCSVKFKEWIVVLATLLRRSEVLFDLFRHDVRLWRAYRITLQARGSFAEYDDLLQELDTRLSSIKQVEATEET